MNKIVIFILAFVFNFSNLFSLQAGENEIYQFKVNLAAADDNKVSVSLTAPKIESDTAYYRFPAMVPGTYSVYNFGRYISDFNAFDYEGNPLRVTKTDTNTWAIADAKKLYKLTYRAEGTFKIKDDNTVFEPAGSNIQPDSNFVINNHCFFGYFDGYINNKYVITFTTPPGFYGATSLEALSINNNEETFTASDYRVLVDNPIMFCKPDTASILLSETKVLFSVYSPGKSIGSMEISSMLKPVLLAIRDYLGGKLPADKYTFLFYFTDKNGVSGASGALEHNQSSMYFLPDLLGTEKKFALRFLVPTCAHEFMHIITPLNLHSTEIGNFDFNKPVMSEHLWLYEGETEYSAYYIQLRQGLISLNDFIDDMNQKLVSSSRYNDTLPFTEMSKGALDIYKRQYGNVYEKGALINLCLDVLIRSESNGEQGLKDIIGKLLQKYGKKNSFNDDDLFEDITSMTSPKIGEFFSNYVAGSKLLPYKEILDKIGIDVKKLPYNAIDLGEISMGFDPQTHRLRVIKVDSTNEIIKELGLKTGDEPIAVNDVKISFSNVRKIFGSVKNPARIGDKLEIEAARPDGNGKFENVKLTAKVSKVKTNYETAFLINKSPSEQQLKIRNAWLGK